MSDSFDNIQAIELKPTREMTASRLRYVLKRLLRDYGLRCMNIRYKDDDKDDKQPKGE